MPASKIIFEDDDFKFIQDYKAVHGASLQWFVTVAVKELRAKLELEQYLKDLPYTQKENDGTIH